MKTSKVERRLQRLGHRMKELVIGLRGLETKIVDNKET